MSVASNSDNFTPQLQHQENVYCCAIDKLIHASPSTVAASGSSPRSTRPITITSAQKTSENGGSSYVVYTFKVGQNETKRRYSEFESLRKALCRLHPTVIVPPIPEKHSIADYATMQNRTKDDLITIEKRKRMLLSFLNRVARHEILSTDHVFHRFLEHDTQWSEVLHSAPLIHLPKNPLTASPANITNPPGVANTPPLAVPSGSLTLRNPDPKFVESEAFTNRFAAHMSGSMDKSQKKIIRKLADLANDYAELGALYNGFSLNESGDLAAALEKVGQAIDSSFMSTGSAVTALEADFSEPLQEYEMFANIIRSVLKYRHLKHVQMEQTGDTLEQKRATLDGLERLENEARRIDDSIKRAVGRVGAEPSLYDNAAAAGIAQISENDDESKPPTVPAKETLSQPPSQPNSGTSSPAAVRQGDMSYVGSRRRGSGSKLLNALSHTIHGMMDADPEATRRNNIGKTKDAIVVLEEQQERCSNDLTQISAGIQQELDRFQKQKVCDLRDLLLAFAKIHLKWCQKNLGSWEEAHAEVGKIQC